MTTKPDCFTPYDAPDTAKADLEKIQADSHRRRVEDIACRLVDLQTRANSLITLPDYGPAQAGEFRANLRQQRKLQAEYEELIGRRVP